MHPARCKYVERRLAGKSSPGKRIGHEKLTIPRPISKEKDGPSLFDVNEKNFRFGAAIWPFARGIL